MNKKMRTISLLMAITLASATFFTGCKSSEPSKDGSSVPTPESKATEPAADDGAKMEGNMYLEGIPLVKEEETFSIIIDDAATADKVAEMELLKELYKQTNVKVDWQVYPYEIGVEKKNLALSSGDFPDAIGGWLLGRSDIVRYGSKEQIFIPLEELFTKYAPTITEVMNITNVTRDMTLPDGHVYSPPYPIPEPKVIFSPWINQAWLTKLNLQMPKTTDELYDVLVKFRDSDPNGNGRKDEIPLTARVDHFYNWFSLFGYPVPPSDLTLVDGKPTFTGTMDFYKDGINYFAKLFKEGLIDPELFTQDMTTYNSKGKGEDATYGTAVLYFPTDISPGFGEDGINTRSPDYAPLPPITSPNCPKPMWKQGCDEVTLFATQFAITNKAKNPATIVRWIDNLYQLDNSMQANIGMYDVLGKKNDDGTYEQLPRTDVTGAPGYAWWIGAMPKYIPTDIFNNKILKSPADMFNKKQNDDMDATWANNVTQMNPAVWLTSEESSKIATIQTDIKSYMEQKLAEWVTGSADVNKEWDAYLKELDAKGLKTFIEVQGGAMTKALAK